MESQLWIILMELHAIDPMRAVRIARAYDEIDDDVPASAELTLAIGDARTYLYANGYFPDCPQCGGWVFPDKAAEHAEHAAEVSDDTEPDEMDTADEIDDDPYSNEDDRYAADDEDDVPSTTEIYGRALAASGGNHELAAEAASMYPGDLI